MSCKNSLWKQFEPLKVNRGTADSFQSPGEQRETWMHPIKSGVLLAAAPLHTHTVRPRLTIQLFDSFPAELFLHLKPGLGLCLTLFLGCNLRPFLLLLFQISDSSLTCIKLPDLV